MGLGLGLVLGLVLGRRCASITVDSALIMAERPSAEVPCRATRVREQRRSSACAGQELQTQCRRSAGAVQAQCRLSVHLPRRLGRAACVLGVAGGARALVGAVRERVADGSPGHHTVCRSGPHRPNAEGGHVLPAPHERLRCGGRGAVCVKQAVEQPTLVRQHDVRGEQRARVALDDGARRVRQK